MNETDMRQLPSGAHFFKCALQVNPFEYLVAHDKPSSFANESEYNAVLIEACHEQKIDAIAVTDHYRVRSAASLIERSKAAGITAFPGFEAVTKDGVHLLCLFDPKTNLDELERILGACGIHQEHQESPTGRYDVMEFLAESQNWGAVCIAAHVASDGGLLRKLSGQSCINAWQSPNLLACSLPGPVGDSPDDLRPILQNKNAEYRREHPVAVLNAKDVSDPSYLKDLGTSCWIKMSEITIDGLRQAFLDPDSRIRLNSDPMPEDHAELLTLAWEGGFLDGAAIHFNPNLNVLIGGRGAGKSTIIESLRYVLGLGPIGEEARKAYEGIVRQVLRSGTKISIRVRSYRPAKREYLIERTIPNPSVVRDESGQILNLLPQEILPRVEVYGQHEISELTKSREKLTRLLYRFVERDESLDRRKADLRRELQKTKQAIMDVRSELQQINERLLTLPGLEETLKRFQEAGLEDRLREQSLLVREEQVLDSIPERVKALRECLEVFRQELPIDRVFLSPKALEELPSREIIAGADEVLEHLSHDLEQVARQLEEALKRADEGIDEIRSRWGERKHEVEATYNKILRELQKSAVDGEEFMRLRREIESLRPLRERLPLLERLEKESVERRRELLAEWEDVKAEEFRLVNRAAKVVNTKLRDSVHVEVTAAGNREPLVNLLKEKIGGRLSEAIEKIRKVPDLSLPELVNWCMTGAEEVQKIYAIPSTQAERLAKAPPDVLMQIEELELPPTTAIQLNTAPAGKPPSWQALEDLSKGQKATAVLLLLLLESEAPLIVDQPEDDLDNRFITEGVVPRMREGKRRRQFLFSTHNANIPVLGDAELILGLTAAGEADEGQARIAPEYIGSIDTPSVRKLVEEILEGGEAAFKRRRLKYGF